MQVHLGTGALVAEWQRAVVCVGTFDGVHLGHQAVIARAVESARAVELPAVLVTFDRHPSAILAPDKKPPALATVRQNLRQFERLGVSVVVVLPFDELLSRMAASAFLDEILVGALRADRLVVGHDFAMGYGREGNPDWLQPRIPTEVVPPFMVGEDRVSSSGLRRAVAAGRVEHVGDMLGRPYALEGVIVGGQRLGRQLGFPTANLARSSDQALPADGVYAGWFQSARGRFMTATAIGTRPAVGGTKRTIESYLLDYPGDSLYGLPVEVGFSHRLREEQNFPNLDALVQQMGKDVQEARRLLTLGSVVE